MDTDEKLKQEQLEYYKRENELREAMIKRQRLYWKLVKWAAIICGLLILLIAVILPSIFTRITADTNGDGYYEVITIPRWEKYKYKDIMWE